MAGFTHLYQGSKFAPGMPFSTLIAGLEGSRTKNDYRSGGGGGQTDGGPNNPVAQGLIGLAHSIAPHFFAPNIQQGVEEGPASDPAVHDFQQALVDTNGDPRRAMLKAFQDHPEHFMNGQSFATVMALAKNMPVGEKGQSLSPGAQLIGPNGEVIATNTNMPANATEATLARAAAGTGPEAETARQALTILQQQKLAVAKATGTGDTQLEKELTATGVVRGSPEWQQALKDKIATDTGTLDMNKVAQMAKQPDVQAWAFYKKATPGNFGGQSLQARYNTAAIYAANPNFRGDLSESKFRYIGGPGMNDLETARFGNNLVQHLDTLNQAYTELANGNVTAANNIANKLSAAFGSGRPQTLTSLSQLVGQEYTKFIVKNGGGEAERQAATPLTVGTTPGAAVGVLNGMLHIVGGQMNGLRQKYVSATGNSDFDERIVSPKLSKTLSAYGYYPATYGNSSFAGQGWSAITGTNENVPQAGLAPPGSPSSMEAAEGKTAAAPKLQPMPIDQASGYLKSHPEAAQQFVDTYGAAATPYLQKLGIPMPGPTAKTPAETTSTAAPAAPVPTIPATGGGAPIQAAVPNVPPATNTSAAPSAPITPLTTSAPAPAANPIAAGLAPGSAAAIPQPGQPAPTPLDPAQVQSIVQQHLLDIQRQYGGGGGGQQ